MTAPEGFALLAVLIGAGAQAITGIGFSLVCAALLTVALGGGDGVRLANVLAVVVNLLVVRREWRGTDAGHMLRLLVPATLAVAGTAWLVGGVSPRVLSVASGVLVLVAAGALAAGLRARKLVGRAGAALAGAVSGAMNVVGGVGGPAAASYAIYAGWSPETTRPTLGVYFVGINLMSVLSRGVPATSAGFVVGAVIALLLGFGVGSLLASRLDARAVRTGTLLLAALGAVGAIAQGLR